MGAEPSKIKAHTNKMNDNNEGGASDSEKINNAQSSSLNDTNNNLKLIRNNYGNLSSDNEEQDSTGKTSNSSFKILTPFVPYKNPFIHEDESSSGSSTENESTKLNANEDVPTQSNSKRQKYEFNNVKASSKSDTKIYRSKISSSTSNSKPCTSTSQESTNKDDSDSDVDLSSITINPKLKDDKPAQNSQNNSTSSIKRKREDTLNSDEYQELSSAVTTDSNNTSMDDLKLENDESESDLIDDHENSSSSFSNTLKKPNTKPKLTPIEENIEVADMSYDTKKPEYWQRVNNARNSFGLNDLVNREFGYSGRSGHGTNFNINLLSKSHKYGNDTEKKLIYNQQMQTPRQFIRKALSGLNHVRRMKLSQNLNYHEGCVNALNFNRVGTMLVSGSDDFQVCIWDWAKNNPILTFDSGHKSNVFQTKFMPFTGDSQIITCARDGQVRLALISSSGSHIGTKKLAKHSDSCHKLAIEYDSCNLFLSCGEDGVVFEIDLRQQSPAKILNVKHVETSNKLPLYSISSNPSNTYQFVVSGKDQFLRIYDKRMLVDHRSKILKTLCPSKLKDARRASITSAVYSYDGNEIIASYSDDDIYLFDPNQEDKDAKCSFKGHRNTETIKGVNFYGSESDYIISGSDCGQVFFWEKSSQQIVNVLKGDEHGIVNVLEPHPNFPFLATSGLDSDIKIWSPSCEKPNLLENLDNIIKDNQQLRENNRHFSLSSFEFELLLLLMHRPNNRVFFRTRDGDVVTESINRNTNNTNGDNTDNNSFLSSATNNIEDILSRPFPFSTRPERNYDIDDEDEDEEDNDDDDFDIHLEDEDEDGDDDDEDDDDDDYNDFYENESENNDSNFTAETGDALSTMNETIRETIDDDESNTMRTTTIPATRITDSSNSTLVDDDDETFLNNLNGNTKPSSNTTNSN